MRALISIFKEHADRHQFIIATHSPAVIAHAKPATIHLLRDGSDQSVSIDAIDAQEASELGTCLAELGVTLSEVFGSESVPWVEGATEEAVFPLLVEREDIGADRIAIVGVKHTSDFDKKTAKQTVELYERFTKSSALAPPAIGFIAATETGRGGFAVSQSDVEQSLARHAPEHARVPSSDPSWVVEVDAAKLLAALFSDLTQRREAYRKVVHGAALATWLLENDRAALQPLVDVLEQALRQTA